MEFTYLDKKCMLKGIQLGLNWSLEDPATFKLSPRKSKGVLLPLMSTSEGIRKAMTPNYRGF
jgi:hypothetical protein